MQNVKPKVIPVIIGATRTITKSFRKYLTTIPVKQEIKELQNTVILGKKTHTSESRPTNVSTKHTTREEQLHVP